MADDVIKFQIFADDKASSKFSKLNNVLKSGIGITKSLAKVTVGTATAIGAFTTVTAKAIDRQGKFAERIGVNIEQLSTYQSVAESAGISTDTFNMATQRMTRRVAEAAVGMGEAQGALKELGIDARNFQGLSLDKQMETLADAMGDTANQNDKLRLAFKLFDSEGTAMLQMLNNGSDSMRAAADDAQFLGLVISQEAAANAAVFTDKLGRATGAMKGLSNEMAGEFMPILAGIADAFANFVANNRTDIVNFAKTAIVNVVAVGDVFSQIFDRIGEILTNPEALVDFVSALHKTAVNVGVLALDMGQVLIRGIFEGINVAKDLFIGFGQWIGESLARIVVGDSTENIGVALARIFTDGLARAKESVGSTITDMGALIAEQAPAIGESLNDAFQIDFEGALEKAESAIDSISVFAETTKEKINTTEETLSQFMATVEAQKKEFTQWLQDNDTQFIETLYSTAQTAVDTLSNGLANAIVTGTSLLDAFRNVAKQIATQIIGAFIKLGIQRLILSTIMGTASKTEAAVDASKAVGLAGANMFASMAAAPFPINLTAPAMATAAIAGASASFTAGAAAGTALGATVGGVFHGGLTNNPEEQTAIIHKNERILSPRQNKDFTDAMANGTFGGGGISVDTIEITMFPNATNAEAVFSLDAEELASSIGGELIEALNLLNRRGLRPDYIEG